MKNKIFIFLILFIVVTALINTNCFSQEEEKTVIDEKGSKQAFIFGKQEYNNQNYERAKGFFCEAINLNPENVEAYYYRALAAGKSGTLDKDISFYKQQMVMMNKKEDYHTRFGLGCSYLVKSETFEGVKKDAQEELNQVLALDKGGPFDQKARELAKQYGINLENPPFNIMEHTWIFFVLGGVVLSGIIIIAVLVMKGAAQYTGIVIITSPQGQMMLNGKLLTLPKKDKNSIKIGSANIADIRLTEGNIVEFHAELIPIKFNKKDRIRIRSLGMGKITKESGGKSEQVHEDLLWDNDIFKIGDYTLNYSNPVVGPRPDGGMMGGGMMAPGMELAPPPLPGPGLPKPFSPGTGGGLPTPPSNLPFPGQSPPPPGSTGGGSSIPPPPAGDDGFSF